MMDICKGLNEEQRQAALVQTNAVVAAGAGSGKTKVLTNRYLYLITEKGCRVDEILALTFTEKAAAEMYQRIYTALQDTVHDCTDSVQYARAERALQEFYRAQIMTVDSFCYKIAKTACRSFGISPDFTIDLPGSQQLALDLALDFFLAHRCEAALQYFLDNHSIKDFVEQFFVKLLLQYVTVSQPLDFAAMPEKQMQALEQGYAARYEKLTNLFAQFEAYLSHKDSFIAEMAAAYQKVPLPPQTMAAEDFRSFLSAFYALTKVNMKKGSAKDPDVQVCKELLKAMRSVYTVLLNEYHVYFQRDNIEKMYALCSALQEHYIAEKKRRGILTFADVERLAVDALIADPDVRLFYKKSISHIMIDEFQDNNSLQRDLLFLLAERYERTEQSVPPPSCVLPDKLFFVGDEKQSIYAFRGADVSVFRKLARDLSGGTETALLHLAMNYRSEPALLHFFNEVFSKVFYSETHRPESGETVPDYEAEFTAIQSREAVQGLDPHVDVLFVDPHRFHAEDALTARDAEACMLAQKIRSIYEVKTPVYDDELKTVRPCRWSDFAILLRASSHQAAYERFLRLYAVPAVSVQQKGLFHDAPLNDLCALLRLAVYPHDRFAYAQVLRSPLVHISDLSVTGLLLHQAPPFDPQCSGGVIAEDVPYFQRACALFARVCGYTKTMSTAELVTALWYDEAYRYSLLTEQRYHRYLELYDYLFALAVQSDAAGFTLSHFVDELTAYSNHVKRLEDMDIPLEQSSDAVKIMTVHKSKGLEFPIVCIPDCGNAGQNEKKDGLVFYHDELGIITHLPQVAGLGEQKNPVFEALRAEANAKLLAEAKRLFYVAMTRAKVHLIMSGTYKTAVQPETLPEVARSFAQVQEAMPAQTDEKNASFFQLFFAAKDLAAHACFRFTEILPADLEQAAYRTQKPTAAHSLLAAQYEAAVEKQFVPTPPPLTSVTQFEKDMQWLSVAEHAQYAAAADDMLAQAAFGTAVHKAIEARFLHKPFRLPAVLQREVEALCDVFFASELGKKAVQAAFRKIEYGFISTYQGKTLVGQIDLLFEDETGIYIVDYKTDSQQRPEEHRTQLLLYKQAVAQLYQLHGFGSPRTGDSTTVKPMKAFLFYLRHGTAVEIAHQQS
ncbi:MAG: UvrD-helicase domain-containing protein [Treponema sp.]